MRDVRGIRKLAGPAGRSDAVSVTCTVRTDRNHSPGANGAADDQRENELKHVLLPYFLHPFGCTREVTVNEALNNPDVRLLTTLWDERTACLRVSLGLTDNRGRHEAVSARAFRSFG